MLLPALTVLCSLLISEPPAVLFLSVGAILLHEWGHLCAFYLSGGERPVLSLEGAGFRLSTHAPRLPLAELFIALAGPACNLLAAALALRLGRDSFALLFAAVHFLYGAFNLLPFGGSDGERALRFLLLRLAPIRGERILGGIRLGTLTLFFYFCLFLHYLTGMGLSGVLLSVFFFLQEQNGIKYLF